MTLCCRYVTGRNAAQWGFHPTRNPSTGWYKVPPAVPLSPAVPGSTRVSASMKPPMGRDSSVNMAPGTWADDPDDSFRDETRASTRADLTSTRPAHARPVLPL